MTEALHGEILKLAWVAVLLLSCVPVAAQNSSSPEQVLEELAASDKPEVILRHVPKSVLQKLQKLPATQRAAFIEKLSIAKNLEREGGILRRSEDGSAWEIVNKQGSIELTISLRTALISGIEALVPLEMRHGSELTTVLVRMKLEDGDWRITDFGPWQSFSIEAAMLREESADSGRSAELAAASTLRTLNTALITYITTYPEVGYPARMAQLAGGETQQPSPDHAMLLDLAFSTEPLVRNGYEFRYTLINAGDSEGSEGRYQITATPVEFGKTGSRSFFTDQTAVLRFTTENRPSNADDPPLD